MTKAIWSTHVLDKSNHDMHNRVEYLVYKCCNENIAKATRFILRVVCPDKGNNVMHVGAERYVH